MPESIARTERSLKQRLLRCALAGFLFNAVLTSFYCWDLLRDDAPLQLRFPDRSRPYPPSMLRYWWDHAPARGAAAAPTYRWSRLTAHGSMEIISAPTIRPHAATNTFDVLCSVEAGWPMPSISTTRWEHSVPFPRDGAYRSSLRGSPFTYMPHPIGLPFNVLFFASYALLCSFLIDMVHDSVREARRERKRRIARKYRRRHLIALLARHCRRCGYDLRGNPTAGCPECGWRRKRVNRFATTGSTTMR